MCRKLICLVSFVLVLSIAGNTSAELVAHWRLDEGSGTTPTDTSGNGRHGEFVGSPDWAVGVSGGALRVSQGNYMVVPGYTGVLGTNARTCSAWIKTLTTNGVIFGWGLLGPGNKWILRVNHLGVDGELRCEVHNGYHYGTTKINDDEWHHVAVVLEDDGSPDIEETKLYVDGELETTGDLADEPINTIEDMDVTIGQNPHASDRWFDGLLDDVRIYDHALTESELLSAMEGSGAEYPFALGPAPVDSAMLQATWASLSWIPGDLAVSHDVYLGDNFDDVNAGAGGTFVGNQATTSLIVGFPGFPFPDGLVPGTTYYWRIDEVNDTDPNSPWKGDVWSFTVPPKTAYAPDPADGAESVDLDVELNWTAGFEAKLHTVYLGDNFDDVSNAEAGLPQGSTTYKPASLKPEKIYYWRVDEFDALATYNGDVWAFSTPGAAESLDPANGAVDVAHTQILSWTPADNATSHEVYLGTDGDAVKNATTTSPEYKDNRSLGSESYDPGKLAWHSNYYWRVDAIYDSGPVKGLVWSFSTADFILVDDFESYDDIDPLPGEPGINRIFDKWIDGYLNPTTNGALVGNDMPPYAETTIVHGGGQSMPYLYDNNLKTSEATLTLVYPRDWTEEGVTKLSLWFRGSSDNAAERMFVALNGIAVVYHDDPAVTQKTGWTRWVIDLQAFADQGVNLANVSTITIGFGTKNSPAAGGSGQMYFDDIRLHR